MSTDASNVIVAESSTWPVEATRISTDSTVMAVLIPSVEFTRVHEFVEDIDSQVFSVPEVTVPDTAVARTSNPLAAPPSNHVPIFDVELLMVCWTLPLEFSA